MFGGKKKLYTEGALTEGQVTHCSISPQTPFMYKVVVRAKFPDGSTTELSKWLDTNYVGQLYDGSVVPVRYDPSDHSKAVIDVPALEERHKQTKTGQQSRLDAQFANMGEPGSSATTGAAGDLGDLKSQLLRMAAEGSGSVIDLRSSQPSPEQSADPVERLSKLAAMKEQGLLTDEEFAAAKAKILGES